MNANDQRLLSDASLQGIIDEELGSRLQHLCSIISVYSRPFAVAFILFRILRLDLDVRHS